MPLQPAIDTGSDRTAADVLTKRLLDAERRLRVLERHSHPDPFRGRANEVKFHGCRIYRSGTLNLAHNTETPVAFDAESYDTGSLHSTSVNPDRVTFDRLGYWFATCQVSYAPSSTGVRGAKIALNGTSYSHGENVNWGQTSSYVRSSDIVLVTALTDYINVWPYQNSGGTLAINPGAALTFLAVAYMGT